MRFLQRSLLGHAGLDGNTQKHIPIPSGAPDTVVCTVTENGRTLKCTSQGYEAE